MASTVLRSQNCFRDRIHPQSLTLNYQSNSAGKSSTNHISNHDSGSRRSHRSLARFREGDGRSRSTVAETPAKNLVMEEVKILKRGENLSSLRKVVDCVGDGESKGSEEFDLFLKSADRLGPVAETMQTQINISKGLGPDESVFAGSGLSFSPSPNSLPIPGFLARNKQVI